MSENVANAKYPQESIQARQPAAYAGNTNSPACDSQLLHNLEESKPSHLTGLATATAKPDLPTSSEQLIKHFHPVSTANSLGKRKAAVIAPSDKVYNHTCCTVVPTFVANKDFDNLRHALKNHQDVEQFFVIGEVGRKIVEDLLYKTQTNITFVRVCETCIKISRLKDGMLQKARLKATFQCKKANVAIMSVKEQLEKECPKAIVYVQYNSDILNKQEREQKQHQQQQQQWEQQQQQRQQRQQTKKQNCAPRKNHGPYQPFGG